ncbi:transporter substrate-binding domain-containing protein [uncultured Shewanella sp.]|uniref:substrate-binding periplasmic protein n=1 Tax=uncultured Shewanella sp. TaxID=173975 RepID=UPI002611820F|nr:transporter substrate-binding domain-containing protein [uncultured Shewanella sp.]
MKRIVIVLTLFLYIWLHCQVSAEETLDIAILEYPPYEYTVNGEFHGVSVRLVEAVFQRIDQPIKLQVLPWSRALKFLKEGKIDGLIEVLIVPERLSYIDFSQVVLMEERITLFVVEDSPITFDGDLTALSDYHFGARQDFSYGSIFDEAVADRVIKRISIEVEFDTLLLKLCTGDIDILIGEKDTIHYASSRVKVLQNTSIKRCKNIKRLSPIIQTTSAYMGFSKVNGLTHIRDRFDEALTEMKRDGSYRKIVETWWSESAYKP